MVNLRADKRLFWFLKDDVKLDLSEPSHLDMYVQQIITHGGAEDIKMLFKNISLRQFELSFLRLKRFLPFEVNRFWEDFIGDSK